MGTTGSKNWARRVSDFFFQEGPGAVTLPAPAEAPAKIEKQTMHVGIGGISDFSKSRAFVNNAYMGGGLNGGNSRFIFSIYDGEKNMGELGPVVNYIPNYQMLRARSWQAMMDSEIAALIINRYCTWVIGLGLKPQAEIQTRVLRGEGINITDDQANDLQEQIEAYFKVFSDRKEFDYAEMEDGNSQQEVAYRNGMVGGDVLVILRFTGEKISTQLIDGMNVVSPIGLPGTDYNFVLAPNGNRIIHGVEVDSKGKHIAYYVRKAGLDKTTNIWNTYETTRVPARDPSTNMQVAFMFYGNKHRIDGVRGMPLISVILETLKKLERYKEAMVGSAEERAKIAYALTQEIGGSGEGIFTQRVAEAFGDGVPITDDGNALATKIAATTMKQVVDLPAGRTLEVLDSKGELYFKDFFDKNLAIVFACMEMPYDVGMMIFTNSYSASRAAIKDFENTLFVKRAKFKRQYNQPIYNFWMHIMVSMGKINLPGYLNAFLGEVQNVMVIGAYQMCRFVGAAVPHIDPLKEVMAEREKLGASGAAIPLTTAEQATENLGGGEARANMQQYARELAESKALDIVEPIPPAPKPGKKGSKNADKDEE